MTNTKGPQVSLTQLTGKGYVSTALVTKESFTNSEKRSLEKKRQNQAKIVDSLTGQPDGKVSAEDARDLRSKLSEMTGIQPGKVSNYLGDLEHTGKIEKLFRQLPGTKSKRRLIGVQLNLDAA